MIRNSVLGRVFTKNPHVLLTLLNMGGEKMVAHFFFIEKRRRRPGHVSSNRFLQEVCNGSVAVGQNLKHGARIKVPSIRCI